MGDNEAYLDNLLKSMNGEDTAGGNDGNMMMSADEIAAMFAALEESAPEEEPVVEPAVEQEEASLPVEEPVTEEASLPVEETVTEEASLPTDEPEEDFMELPEDLLSDLLQKFEQQEAEDVEADLSDTKGSEGISDLQETYTTESTQNMSAEEIEQLLAATEQQAENDITETDPAFKEETFAEEMDQEDLLALLGSLDANAETDDENLFGEQGNFYADDNTEDVMSGMAVAERAKERKERKKKEKLENQAAKKALKDATKEAKKAAKEAKKQQAQRQKTSAAEMTLDEVSLEEAVKEETVGTESVLDLFGDGESDGGDIVSIFDLAGIADDEAGSSDNQAEVVMSWDDFEGDSESNNNTASDKKSVKSKKKEKGDKKKDGLFSKLFAFLTEEDEEPASTDENQLILDELEAEDKEEADKKKKDKKGKATKGKKGKDDTEGEDEEKGDKKKEKKKKPPKPKKIKEFKLKPVVEERPSKRVSPKSIAVILAFAATIFLVVYFAGSYFSTELHRKDAKAAFERMDYASCYAGLYGMELSEEEREMLKHAELVLKMQRRIEIYETYLEDEKELEALDSLMQAIAEYEDTYAKALDCGAGPEVAALYEDVLEILKTSYGVSQEEAHTIAACESNVEYTRYLTALIDGGDTNGAPIPEEELQDILPAEEELANPDFAD